MSTPSPTPPKPFWADFKDLSVIGKSTKYIDAYERLTGRAQFASDIVMPGMLYAHATLSPHAHAKILKIDTSKAEALPGVKAVITGREVEDKWTKARLRVNQPIIALDKVRVQGEFVAVVAAESDHIARHAASLVEVEYEKLPFYLDPEEALKPDSLAIHEGGNLVGGKPTPEYNKGDIAKGFAESDVIVEDRIAAPKFVNHSNAETYTVVAWWEGERLHLINSNQWNHGTRNAVAAFLGLPNNKVRVVSKFMGMGLGDKAGANHYVIVAAILAKKTGQPVKFFLDRNEYMVVMTQRYPVIQYMKVGFKKNGKIVAIDARQITAAGGYFNQGAVSASQTVVDYYNYDHLKYQGFNAYTNTPQAGAYRCVGHPQGNFNTESFMDIAAEKLGIDPLTFRKINVIQGTQKHPLTGEDYARPMLMNELIDAAAEKFRWKDRWKGFVSPTFKEGPIRRGVGLSVNICSHGSISGVMSAVTMLNTDGTVDLLAGATDIGGGQRTAMSMIAAEAVGAKLRDVRIEDHDTDTAPDVGGTFGSRQTPSGGSAIALAGFELRKKILEIAAGILNAKPEDLDAKNSEVFLKADPSKKTTFKAIAARQPFPLTATAGYRPPPRIAQRTLTVHMGEIEVDIETGLVKVVDYLAAHDSGRVINPVAFIDQVRGGVIQGIGMALREGLDFDPTYGHTLNPDWLEYKVPTFLDLPPKLEVIYRETLGPWSMAFGAHGIGEPPITPPMAVVANGLYNATGVRVKELPLDPRNVLTAIKLQGVKS